MEVTAQFFMRPSPLLNRAIVGLHSGVLHDRHLRRFYNPAAAFGQEWWLTEG